MRILFTTSNFDTAGSGKVIYDLIHGLDKNKFDIEIACGHDRGHYYQVIQSLNLPIHVFHTKTAYRPYFSLLYRILKISKFFKSHDYDLIHSWQWSNDWTEAVAAKLAGIPWIYTKKAMGFESKHWRIKSFLANHIITINDDMRAYFSKKRAQSLIPLGIDTAYYSPEHFPDLPESETFQIITVANLAPVKGIEVLLHAIHQLKDPQVRLTILGYNGNDYGQAMQALSQSLGLQHQVNFINKTADVRPYIAASNLYVIPTLDQGRKEGMPMALVEAMSMGIPVLGSNISGIKYVLKDFNNLLFKAGDSHALRELILDIKSLSYDEQRQLGASLRSYCISHFTLERFIGLHEALYNKFKTITD